MTDDKRQEYKREYMKTFMAQKRRRERQLLADIDAFLSEPELSNTQT